LIYKNEMKLLVNTYVRWVTACSIVEHILQE